MSHVDSYRTGAGSTHANDVVSQWLAKAAADLLVAERESQVGAGGSHDAVCFHAQQAVEKLMKSALIAAGANAPKTHDLVHLDALLQKALPGWGWEVQELSLLTTAAVEVRYPGFSAAAEDGNRMLGIAVRIWGALRPRV